MHLSRINFWKINIMSIKLLFQTLILFKLFAILYKPYAFKCRQGKTAKHPDYKVND